MRFQSRHRNIWVVIWKKWYVISLSLSLAWSHTKQNWGMRRNWVLPWSKILQFRPCQPYAWATCFTKRKGWVGIRFPCFRSWLWKALSAKAETRQQTTDVAAVSAAAALAARQEMTTNTRFVDIETHFDCTEPQSLSNTQATLPTSLICSSNNCWNWINFVKKPIGCVSHQLDGFNRGTHPITRVRCRGIPRNPPTRR